MVVPITVSFLAVIGLVLDRAEIEDLDDVALARLTEEDVVGLEIAVDQLARVGFVERRARPGSACGPRAPARRRCSRLSVVRSSSP